MGNPKSAIRNPQSAIPPAFIDRMTRLLGQESAAFLASYDAAPRTGLRVNTLKVSGEAYRRLSPFPLEPLAWTPDAFLTLEPLFREHVTLSGSIAQAPASSATGEASPHAVSSAPSAAQAAGPGRHPHHAAGLYYLQDPSAMVVAELLDPQPGERVLDLAAAPGGKATAIASLMRNEGLLMANEIHGQRVWDLAENLERWGAHNAVITHESPERLAERLADTFDRVLLDAPCSGEGMFRRSEAARREWSPELVHGCALRQSHILAQAARLVRPGGRLVYATCTFAPEEDEGVIAAFLDSRPDFSVLELARLPGFGPGRPDWAAAGGARPELRQAIRLWPHTGPGDGHFVAMLQRVGDSAARAVERWRPQRIPKPSVLLYRAFCEETLVGLPGEDRLALAGAYLYAAPPGAPDLAGLRFIHPGWWLGTLKKERLEPSHALALGLSLDEVRPDRVVDLASGGQEVLAYLRGESLALPGAPGWVLVAVDGFPLGWGKRVDGVVKSHYPKGLRWA
jgi:NOL1/NOP2/sun family putative RNA methylase